MTKFAQYILIIQVVTVLINGTVYPQWERIPNFHCISNDAILVDSSCIWGGGNLGKLYKFNYKLSNFTYFQIDEKYDIYSLFYNNDTSLFLAGRNWQVSNGFLVEFNPNSDSIVSSKSFPQEIYDIEFITIDTGFIVSYSGIHHTTNGGESWEIIWNFQSIGAQFGELYSIAADNNGNIFASGRKRHDLDSSDSQGFILKSANYGLGWEIVYEVPDGYITNLDYRHGKIYCHDKNDIAYYFSNDSGNTWEASHIPLTNPGLRIADIHYLSQNHTLACIAQEYVFLSEGQYFTIDQIVSSTDSGQTWYNQFENHPRYPPRDTTLNTFVSINDTTIFCFGWRLCLKTTNQGGQDHPILFLKKTLATESFHIYPNPAKDFIVIEGLKHTFQYEIYTIQGDLIQKRNNALSRSMINVNKLKPGIYVVRVYSKTVIHPSQIFIKN